MSLFFNIPQRGMSEVDGIVEVLWQDVRAIPELSLLSGFAILKL